MHVCRFSHHSTKLKLRFVRDFARETRTKYDFIAFLCICITFSRKAKLVMQIFSNENLYHLHLASVRAKLELSQMMA